MLNHLKKTRTRLFLLIASVVLASSLIFAVAARSFIVVPLSETFAETHLSLVSGNLEGEIRAYFDAVERQLRIAKEGAVRGFFDSEDVRGFNRFFLPALSVIPSVSAAIYAREDSRELILFKDEAGWRDRITDGEALKGKARWFHWNRAGELLKEETLPSTYDARTRPWFAGALGLADETRIFWTEPYVFYTKGEPGITASIRFADPKGRKAVLGLDVALRDISAMTGSVAVGEEGFIAVLDKEGRLLALPRKPGKSEDAEAEKAALLRPLGELKNGTLSAGHDGWIAAGKKTNRGFRFRSFGEAWLGRFTSFALGSNEFLVGTFAPAKEFSRYDEGTVFVLGVIVAVCLLFSAVFAGILSRLVGDPIARLANRSSRIGRLDFTPAAPEKTPWEEINRLAEAIEEMRELLKASTRGLEEKVQARTKELQDQLAFIIQLIDALPNPIFYKGADGRYLGCNRAYEEAFGLRREYITGKTVLEIEAFTEEERRAYYEGDAEIIRTGKTQAAEVTRTFTDGRSHALLHWISGFRLSDGSPGGLLGIFVDVSELKEKEEELSKARFVAEDAAKAKSLFLANMSHEIRTPMNAIIGMAYLALKTDLTPKQREYLDKIHNAGTSLLGIINDILDFSKVEAGKIELENADFLLEDVIAGVTSITSAKTFDKGLEFLCHVAEDVPSTFRGDSLRLGQVLTNLVNNAVKFTERGEISVSVRLVQSTGTKAELQFDVRDTGIGMTPEQAGRIFKAFTQADGSTTRRYGGTGLGLSISKRLIELMEGSIWVESTAGFGSTFSFTVWLGLAEKLKNRERTVPSRLEGLKTLVIDDNEEAREILAEYLASFRFKVAVAASGEEGLAIVKERDEAEAVDVVFLDWKMPGMNGLKAARLLKEDRSLKHPPAVVMVTAFEQEEVRWEAEAIPVDGFILKPVGKSLLFDTIVRIFVPPGERKLKDEDLQSENYRLEGLRILLAEDNEINRQIAVELLASQGIEVETAENGRVAVEKALAGRERWDLILLDLQMPEMDGLDACCKLRSEGVETPIVAMTARAMTEERELCLKAGMNDHIAKPIDPHVLFTTIGRWAREDRKKVRETGTPSSGGCVLRDEEPAPGFPAVAGVDTASGLKRAAGNAKLYRELLLRFAEGWKDAAERTRKALAAGNRPEAERLLHALKGVAGNLGLEGVRKTAEAAERELKARPSGEAGGETAGPVEITALAELDGLLARATEALEKAFPAEEAPRKGEAYDPAKALPTLRRLADLLGSNDAEAVDFFNSRSADISGAFQPRDFKRLEDDIKKYLFEEAFDRIEKLLKTLEQKDAREP